MIKNIIRDEKILMIKSLPATIEDLYIKDDLLDTLKFNRSRCVGMAANMIGISKRIIIFENEKREYVVMFNPKIIRFEEKFEAEEGCLSLDGSRKTIRYKKIKVEFFNEKFQKRIQTFTGFTAQIIQHEIDHLNGIII